MHVLVSACLMLMLGTERVALVGGDSTPGGMQTGAHCWTKQLAATGNA